MSVYERMCVGQNDRTSLRAGAGRGVKECCGRTFRCINVVLSPLLGGEALYELYLAISIVRERINKMRYAHTVIFADSS